MSKNSEQLLTKLKGSLPRGRKGPASEVQPHPITAAVRAPKLSVSLYQRDLQILDQIKAFMQQQGFRNLNDSEALRLACRTAPIGEELVRAYQDMQSEDGRRKAS